MTTHRRGRPRRLLVGELVHVQRSIMSIGCEVTRIRPTIRVRPVLAGGEPDLDEEAFEVPRHGVERRCGELDDACARFNTRHPVGSVVRFFPVEGQERHEDRRIRGAADSVHGIAVVWLEGRAGFVACSFCQPVPAAEEAHVRA